VTTVPSDTALAISESVAREVREQVRHLLAQAGRLNRPDPAVGLPGRQGALQAEALTPEEGVGAAVAAIPDLLTLLSAERTISTVILTVCGQRAPAP
jgi:hypothetical protein